MTKLPSHTASQTTGRSTGESPWSLPAFLLAIYWLGSFTLTHLPGSSLRGLKLDLIPHQDKLVHLILYAGLAFLLAAWCRRLGFHRWISGLVVLALSAGYGVADEWLQQFIPYRSMDVWDWAADVVGAFLGLTLYAAWRRLNATWCPARVDEVAVRRS